MTVQALPTDPGTLNAALQSRPEAVSALEQARARAGKDPQAAAEEFESVFLTNFLNTMFSGLSAEAPFGGGSAEETWRGFLAKEYADQIVASGGIGIADSVARELVSIQERAEP